MADADAVDIRSEDGFVAIASGVLSGGRRVPAEGPRANDEVDDLPRRPDTEGSAPRGGGGRGRVDETPPPPATEGSGGPPRG